MSFFDAFRFSYVLSHYSDVHYVPSNPQPANMLLVTHVPKCLPQMQEAEFPGINACGEVVLRNAPVLEASLQRTHATGGLHRVNAGWSHGEYVAYLFDSIVNETMKRETQINICRLLYTSVELYTRVTRTRRDGHQHVTYHRQPPVVFLRKEHLLSNFSTLQAYVNRSVFNVRRAIELQKHENAETAVVQLVNLPLYLIIAFHHNVADADAVRLLALEETQAITIGPNTRGEYAQYTRVKGESTDRIVMYVKSYPEGHAFAASRRSEAEKIEERLDVEDEKDQQDSLMQRGKRIVVNAVSRLVGYASPAVTPRAVAEST